MVVLLREIDKAPKESPDRAVTGVLFDIVLLLLDGREINEPEYGTEPGDFSRQPAMILAPFARLPDGLS